MSVDRFQKKSLDGITGRCVRMKILILANDDLGLYRFRKDLIEALLKKNKVYISLPYGKHVDPLKKMGCRFINTPIDRRGLNPLTDLKLIARYRRIIKKLRPDLVITYTIKPNIYGGTICRMYKIPVAANVTGLGSIFEHEGPLQRIVCATYRFSLKKARVIFVENSSIKDVLISKKIAPESRICVLNGAGVNLKDFSYAPYPHNETFSFLFVGRIMREKGIEELLEAVRRLNQEGLKCILHLVGYPEEDYDTEIQKGCKEGWLCNHGLQENVYPFIEAADCMVLPSWHEGMANTNLEGASVGRPIITSNIPGCREAVLDHVSGFLCEKKDADSLYDAMKRMFLLSREERAQMGREGRRHMEQTFDKTIVVGKTMKYLL